MIEPIFGFIGTLGLIVSLLIIGGILAVFATLATLLFIRKVEPGYIGVRVGFLGYVISDTWIVGIPLLTTYKKMDISVKKLDIERKGHDGLICEDNIRADIEVAFYIKVNYPKVDYGDIDPNSAAGQALADRAMKNKNRFDDIRKVAQTVGCDRASDVDKLKELFEAKFSEALKTAGKLMEFQKLYTDRIRFREEIKQVIGHDLNGYALEDVAIDYLEQTPVETLNENNVLDAEGIKKITDMTAGQQEITNRRENDKKVLINEQNKKALEDVTDRDKKAEIEIRGFEVEADKAKRALDKDNLEDEAVRTREVEIANSDNKRVTELQVAENDEKIGIAKRDKERAIKKNHEDNRAIEVSAEFGVEQSIKREEQNTILAEEESSLLRREKVQVQEQLVKSKVIEESKKVAESDAQYKGLQREVTIADQLIKDEEADRQADRKKRVEIIKATTEAEASQVEREVAAEATRNAEQKLADLAKYKEVVAADAAKEASEREAAKKLILADADAKASEKINRAMQQEAEGTAAMQAAPGVAEANVMKAMAESKIADAGAEEALGLAEASVIAKQGEAAGLAKAAEGKGEGEAVRAVKLAEAEGKTEMAKAIELFNKASQDHEEFRLQLSKDRDVDLAEIQITKDVAEAQARVVGEALKSANIDIVGGENDFFEKVVKSVIQGRSVDRLMNNSQTLSDVKNTFFTGDPDHFKGQLRTWIQDLGVSSEDVKNLTVAALLTKLMSKADDGGTKSLIRQAAKAAKETGITDIVVSALLGDKAAK